MNAGVMGLSVNSSKLSTISDNIANSETKGYKRTNIEFNSLVLTERPTSYDSGGVRAATARIVDEQGALLSTRNELDLAISGRGFLAVNDVADVKRGETNPTLKLLRTGAFRPDEAGRLVTNSGLALLGWKPDANGAYADSLSQTNLEPVELDTLSLAAERTTEVDVKLNLFADATTGETFSTPIEFFDPLGRTKTMQMDFAWISDNLWSLRMYENDAAAWDENNSREYLVRFSTGVETIGGGGYDLNPKPAGGIAEVWESAGSVAGTFDPSDALTFTDAAATAPAAGAVNASWDTPAATSWNVDAAAEADERGLVTLTTLAGGALKLKLGAMNDTAEPAATVVVNPTAAENLVQFTERSTVLSTTKDGSPASTLVGVEIDETGLMDAIYDSGFRKNLYKIPAVNVSNPNGLKAEDGQAFTITRASGDPAFLDPGEGPTGLLVSSALEESTTDIAEELTQLIKTQRAYSSNAKIIQTVDEMLQETTNLKR
jgi:flagellar hook protein FlgE